MGLPPLGGKTRPCWAAESGFVPHPHRCNFYLKKKFLKNCLLVRLFVLFTGKQRTAKKS